MTVELNNRLANNRNLTIIDSDSIEDEGVALVITKEMSTESSQLAGEMRITSAAKLAKTNVGTDSNEVKGGHFSCSCVYSFMIIEGGINGPMSIKNPLGGMLIDVSV